MSLDRSPHRVRTLTVIRSRIAQLMTLWVVGACEGGAPVERHETEAVSVVGELEKYVVDHADGSHRAAFALRRDDGVRVELATSASWELQSGDRVVLRGRYVGHDEPLSSRDDLRLASRRFSVEQAQLYEGPVGVVQQALLAPPQVTVRTAVVLLDFEGRAPQGYSAATARAELDEVERYYLDMSYGSWHMESDVFGPYVVPTPSACNLEELGDLARRTAQAKGVDVGSYDHVAVKVGGIAGMDCPCGVAWVGTPPARGAIRNGGTSLYTCGGANAYAHELGHGLGLDHSSSAPCSGVAFRAGLEGCDIVEYGNAYNTMGNGLGHFNGAQKAMLGWLNGCNVQRVSADTELDLTAIQLAVDGEPQALQIDTGSTRGGAPLYFYVEYRNPALTPFNAKESDGTVRERGPGLHVTVSRDFRDSRGEARTILIDASSGLKGVPLDGQTTRGDPRMVVGDTFKPTDLLSIQFVSRTERTAHVKVSFAGGGSGSSVCQPSKVPPGPSTVPPGFGAMLFQDCDYQGGWSLNLPEGRYTTAQLRALGARDDDTSSMVLAHGYDAVLYADDQFSGRSVQRTKSVVCFSDIDMNDALSSIEIVANGLASAPDAAVEADADAPLDDAGAAANEDADVAGAGGRDTGRDDAGGADGESASDPETTRDAGTSAPPAAPSIVPDGGAAPTSVHAATCSVRRGGAPRSPSAALLCGALAAYLLTRRSRRRLERPSLSAALRRS